MSTITATTTAEQTTSTPTFTVDDLEPLKWFLYGRHYASFSVYRILDHVVAHRTLAGVIDDRTLDPEDEALAYEVLESCFPPVGDDPWDWDLFSEADRWELGPPIPRDAAPVPPDLDLDAEAAAFWPGQ